MNDMDSMTLFNQAHIRNPSLPVLILTAQEMVITMVRCECPDLRKPPFGIAPSPRPAGTGWGHGRSPERPSVARSVPLTGVPGAGMRPPRPAGGDCICTSG